MRIALISDIHGNAIALEAVLAEVDGERVDRTICLGDVATLGSQPREVLDILRERRMVSVLGNHDEFLFVPELLHQYATGAPIEAAVDWCRGQLRPADFDYLMTFERELMVPWTTAKAFVCSMARHGPTWRRCWRRLRPMSWI